MRKFNTKVILSVLCFFTITQTGFAQIKRQYANNYNGWFAYSGSHKLTDKWGLHLEIQWRRSNMILDNQQLLTRGGINYYLNGQIYLTAGYCHVLTYPYGAFAAKSMFPENRIWEQINFKSNAGIIEINNRLRLEQRYVHSPVLQDNGLFEPGDATYTNRARALLRFSVPLKGKAIEDRTWYVSGFNEVFINFGKNVGYNILDQNRAYLGLGYKLPKLGRLEVGYLNQLVLRSDGIKVERNHTVQVSLSSNIEFRKKKE